MDYLTEAEHTKLSEELKHLISERLVISDRIGTARELGDLKENADYHAAKDDQAHNERKRIESRAKNATRKNAIVAGYMFEQSTRVTIKKTSANLAEV